MLACFCLNITIETAPNDFQKVTPESLGLSEEEKADQFFKQDIQKIGNLLSISKVHSCLVKKRNVGEWTISRCINCDCHTHAVHRQKGASMVVIYSKLLNAEAISSVKSSDIFSTIYNIVVNPNDIGLDMVPSANSNRYFPPEDVHSSLRTIRDIMTRFINKESIAVQERIVRYNDDQYEMLNYWKDRAFKEHESLAKVICSAIEPEPGSTKKSIYGFYTPVASSSRPVKQTEKKQSGGSASPYESPSATSWKQSRPDKGSPSKYTDSEELIFEFESDEVNSAPSTDVDESDREEKEEGISIPRSTPARPNVAKSLPMNIPAFITKPRHASGEEVDASPVGENVDIAASMKELAKSVHGEAIFGDLPRPRFNAEI